MVSIFAGITALVSSESVVNEFLRVIFIIPLGLVAVFAYISYEFRITAILRGHLAALEEKMNKELGEDVHMWNSALVETFMAHNNSINNMMMVPILCFILLLTIYCLYYTWKALVDIPYAPLIFGCYWLIIVIGVAIVLPPFLQNDKIRKVTYDQEKVMDMYKKYKKQWEKEKPFNYKEPKEK